MISCSCIGFCGVLQEGRDPDYSEYKEFKLTVENLGFQMLMKMGWKEGDGLGSGGQGIKAPVHRLGAVKYTHSQTHSIHICTQTWTQTLHMSTHTTV